MSSLVEIYTDGSNAAHALPCEQHAGCGAVLLYYPIRGQPRARHVQVGRYIGCATNNVAELSAIKLGLEKAVSLWFGVGINVWTDSEYCKGVLNLTEHDPPWWEFTARKNRELIDSIRGMILSIEEFKIAWIRGHNKHEHNELAHQIATICRVGRKDLFEER